ncbi:MAG: ATP-binding cassette domain-containing protein [bacterium]
MVEVDAVSKNYGRIQAVKDVSFNVREGEILGLLGPNAAGKSTLMRIATGYLPATSGTVRVDGFDVFEQPAQVKRQIGYLPEVPPLYVDMTVGSYLHFVASIKEIPPGRRAERVGEAVEKAGLRGFEKRLVGNLSRGYRQRVGLAQALLTDPPVLILDEPTVGMDPRQIIEIRLLITSLKGSHTVIYSSHIIPEVSATCDRIVILHQGRVLAQGTVKELAGEVKEAEAFRVELKAPMQEALDTMRQLEGVRGVFHEGGDGGWCAVRVEAPPGADVREEIIKCARGKNWPLREIHKMEIGLEEVFLRLTERAGRGEAA